MLYTWRRCPKIAWPKNFPLSVSIVGVHMKPFCHRIFVSSISSYIRRVQMATTLLTTVFKWKERDKKDTSFDRSDFKLLKPMDLTDTELVFIFRIKYLHYRWGFCTLRTTKNAGRWPKVLWMFVVKAVKNFLMDRP